MRVKLSQGMPVPVRLLKEDDGEHVLLIEDKAYTRAEVARNVERLNDVLAQFDTPERLRESPLTYREMAESLGVSVKWVQRRVSAGMIPCYRVGVKVLFEPSTLPWVKAKMRSGEMELRACNSAMGRR